MPFKNSRPEKCYRFQPLKLNRSDHKLFYTNNELNGHCDKTSFNQSMIIKCPDDNFIYRTDEISIVNEVNIVKGQLLLVGIEIIQMHFFICSSTLLVRRMHGS